MSGRTKRVVRLLAMVAAGTDYLDLANDLVNALDIDEVLEFHSCLDGDDKLNSRGWEALRAYNERAGADAGEDCSEAGDR